MCPSVPTVVELGYPDLVVDNYFGVSGPAGLPKDVSDKLAAALADIVAQPAKAVQSIASKKNFNHEDRRCAAIRKYGNKMVKLAEA